MEQKEENAKESVEGDDDAAKDETAVAVRVHMPASMRLGEGGGLLLTQNLSLGNLILLEEGSVTETSVSRAQVKKVAEEQLGEKDLKVGSVD